MFEAALTPHDRERTQRLMLAGLIALSATSATLAGIWTLERLIVDRVGPPEARFELAQLSFLPPPPVAEPPPPPTQDDSAALAGGDAPQRSRDDDPPAALDDEDDDDDPTPMSRIPEPSLDNIGKIPPIGRCPGGICVPTTGKGPGTGPGPGPGKGHCMGPGCKGTGTGTGSNNDAPLAVSFSSLSCLVCPDPDQAQLRKTAASLRRGSGEVVIHFCVDTRGHIEARSLKVRRSFGDVAVDEIARDAVSTWRFSPMEIDGTARRACSDARFDIRFE